MRALPPFEIAHVALSCTDLPAMESFYQDVLGYEVVWRPDPDNCYLSRGADSLALHVAPGATTETRLDHFGFTLATAEAVDAWADHIRAQGIALDQQPKTHRDGTRSFYVRDPEGNRIQFLHLGPTMTLGGGP